MKKIILIASLLSLVAFGSAQAGDAAAGKAKSAMCAGCHGADGNSAAPNFPKLAGQHANYTAKQLADFKSGARKDATMAGMVAGLSDADMADLGAFYAAQTIKTGKADETKIHIGEMIYRSGNSTSGVSACAACHSPNGAGNPQAKFPALAGQHAAYTVAQLKKFAAAERENDAGSMMRTIAGKMTPAEIDAVASYIEGLK